MEDVGRGRTNAMRVCDESDIDGMGWNGDGLGPSEQVF